MFSSRVHAAPSCSGIKARRRRKTSKEERVCAVCGQAFKKAEHLARHLRSHTKEKPFSCTVCSKAFARQDTLLRHSRSHATGREDGEKHAVSLEPESHGCLDPELMSQISIATGVPTIPIHPEMTMPDDMISPPSSASIDKRTPDFSISEHSYHSQMTPLASFFSLEATDSWRNQECPPPPLWDSRLDQEWETLLTGDDFDLNAVNMSLLSASSQYIPAAEFPFDLNTTTSQPLPVDQQAKPHSNTVQRKWHTFCEMSSSGQMTPDVPNEENYIDETYRKRLADRLQQPVQTGILPSTPFLDLCIQAYFSKFHPLFPVVHMASFRPGTQNSILLLSICSVGSLFVGSSRAVNHGISMFERLNKAILASWDTYTFKSGGSSFIALQASIIGQSFGLLLGRPKDLIGIDIFHGSIIAWARKAKLFNLQPAEYHLLDTEGPSLEEVWMNWVQSEVKQRIILGLHIHDALLSRIHHHEPLLHNSLDRLPQISSNELFTASNASTWKSLMLETQANPGPLTHPSPTQRIQHQSRTPSDFALNGLLESINALTYEDQEHHSPTPDWIHTVQKSHKLLTNFHIKYNPHPNKPSGYSHPNPSYTHTWPCTMILWHSIFITLHTDINALENSLGREGHNPNTPTYAKSWIRTQDAKRALLHAMLLQRQFETLPAGAEPAIHVPLSLYYCGILWACFLCFGRLDQGLDLDQGQDQGVPVTLSAGDARHFDELGLEGVDGVVFLEQLGSSILPGRLAMGSLLRVVDLLQRVNHFRIARRLAETLLAVVEETQGLF